MAVDNYLKRILTSKVYDVAFKTPLEKANILSTRMGNTILLKREDMQSVFSFKIWCIQQNGQPSQRGFRARRHCRFCRQPRSGRCLFSQ